MQVQVLGDRVTGVETVTSNVISGLAVYIADG